VFYKRQELLTIRKHLGSPPFLVGSVLFIFLVFCVMFFVFVLFVFVLYLVCPMLPVSLDCLRPVSSMPNVARVSGLSSSCI
jgi:hypothetical protein